MNKYINNEYLIDFHTHTNYSDGDLTPDELLEKANKENIKIIAITDHDSVLGLKNITYDYKKDNIKLISGIELSAKTLKGRMHILGYNINIDNELSACKDKKF